MQMKLLKSALGLAPILLGAACITSETKTFEASNVKAGQNVLIGYFRSPLELTIYTNAEDAKAHRYKNCINGIIEGTALANTILYDNKLVEIRGSVEEYPLVEDPLEAMLATIKNNCNASKIFVAKHIRVLNR